MNGFPLTADSAQVLAAFGCYIVGVAVLGILSHRLVARGNFVSNYFIGGRSLGPWVLALSVAATAISGGTFMGVPSFIYTNGWVIAPWIASYMVTALFAMALMGKRLNQVARMSDAVTVPDVLRDRYRSPALGIIATLSILLFVSFNLVAQFKGGGTLLQQAMDLPRHDLRLPATGTTLDVLLPFLGARVDFGYLIGLGVFALTVVGYTAYGGYWAITWTDVLQGLVMLTGLVIMAILAVRVVPTYTTTDGQTLTGLAAANAKLLELNSDLVYGPGPNRFLPLGLMISFFLMWTVSSAGQPSGMVRLMSFKDTRSLRRAVVLVGFYYFLTYVCILIIFICARAIYPTEYLKDIGSEGNPDKIMPVMIRTVAPHPILAGFLMAAPYAAIMSTVAAFLLMISSSLVRDIYQRTISPNASEKTIRRLSYTITSVVGVTVLLGALNPPHFLQYVIVFTTSAQSAAFFFPMLLTLYWRRTTKVGVMAGLIGGAGTVLFLYVLGWIDSRIRARIVDLASTTEAGRLRDLHDSLSWIPDWGSQRLDAFAPLYVGGFDPLVWGLMASFIVTVIGSRLTTSDEELARKYFPE